MLRAFAMPATAPDWVIPLKATGIDHPWRIRFPPVVWEMEETPGKSEGFYKQTRGFPQPPRTKSGMIGTQKVFTSTWSWTCPKNINPKKSKMENVVHFMDNLFNLPFSSCFSLDDDPSNPVGWPADEAANKSPRPREGCPPSAWALDHRKKVRTITGKSVFTCLLACLSCFFCIFTWLFTTFYYYVSKI